MKKIVFILPLFVFIVTSTFAQDYPVDKGSKMILGGITFSSMGGDLYENSDGDRATMIEIMPSIGFFVAPGFAIAGDLLYNRTSQGDDSKTTLGIGPKLIYVIGANTKPATIKGTTYPYLGASFMYLHSTSKYTWGGYEEETEEYTTTGTAILLGGGILNMISNSLGLFVELGYQMDNLKPEDADKSTSGNKINIRIGITGFLY